MEKDKTPEQYKTEDRFLIEGLGGKRTLSGSVTISGAKNAVLKAMAASVLFKDPVSIKNAPDIEDVRRMVEVLTDLGVSVRQASASAFVIDPRTITHSKLSEKIAGKFRASVVLTGPLLARYGKVHFPHPGGCVIGARPIDIFLYGFKKMGATIKTKGRYYEISASHALKPTELFFKVPSVTATETFMMAAVLIKGKTVIKNAAMEPEISHLADFLNKCGAKIEGAGTPTITIQGGGLLSARGKSYMTLPDRIEAGSFLILAALAGKKVEIKKCCPENLEILIELLREAGVSIKTTKDSIIVQNKQGRKPYQGFSIKTHEYPGFVTDLQSPAVVFLTQALGENQVFETIFEGRLSYVEDLIKMGADITICDPHRIIVKGQTKLSGRQLAGPDLRAGLAYIIAATVASGQSVIGNVYNIDRGYEKIEHKLAALGLSIKRTSAEFVEKEE